MNPLLSVHIAAGTVALLAGGAVLGLRKGSRRHAAIGTWFFFSMLVMSGTGTLVAALKPERGTAVIGIFTAYLVATSWAAARRRDGRSGRLELVALAIAAGCAILMIGFGLQANASPDGKLDSLPAAPHFLFGALAVLAAALDLNFIFRDRISGTQRIARHLWRMCAALLIAALSFFLGQQDEFPAAWRGAFIWFLPPLAVFGTMTFWLIRIRFPRAFARLQPNSASASA